MARFEMYNTDNATMGGEARADVFCDMGLMYATGRSCAVDLVSAHKWLNIAAIKGSERAAELRADLAQTMSKLELAAALRAAREWMTMHCCRACRASSGSGISPSVTPAQAIEPRPAETRLARFSR